MGPGGTSNLEVVTENFCGGAPYSVCWHDLYCFSGIWLGKTCSDPEAEGFFIYDRDGPGHCHAHLLASPGLRLFSLCDRVEVKLLGHLDWLFRRLFVDVSPGTGCLIGNTVSRSLRNRDESHGQVWMGHPCTDHRSLLYLYNNLPGYLLDRRLWTEHRSNDGGTKRHSPGGSFRDGHGSGLPFPSEL